MLAMVFSNEKGLGLTAVDVLGLAQGGTLMLEARGAAGSGGVGSHSVFSNRKENCYTRR